VGSRESSRLWAARIEEENELVVRAVKTRYEVWTARMEEERRARPVGSREMIQILGSSYKIGKVLLV
jgi:hypothetical protein